MILDARKRRDRLRRVWLNGEDVSDRCYWLNTKTGEMRLYQLQNGHKFVKWDARGVPYAARERRHGRISVGRKGEQ